MTQSEYAEHANVNRSTISRWIKNGRISKESSGLIDPDKADTQRDSTESPLVHHQARKAQIDADKEASDRQPHTGELSHNLPAEQISLKYKYATMREREHKAEAAALELDKQHYDSLRERAHIYYSQHDYEKVARDAARMIGIRPDKPQG